MNKSRIDKDALSSLIEKEKLNRKLRFHEIASMAGVTQEQAVAAVRGTKVSDYAIKAVAKALRISVPMTQKEVFDKAAASAEVKRLMASYRVTQVAIADRLGVTRQAVADALNRGLSKEYFDRYKEVVEQCRQARIDELKATAKGEN